MKLISRTSDSACGRGGGATYLRISSMVSFHSLISVNTLRVESHLNFYESQNGEPMMSSQTMFGRGICLSLKKKTEGKNLFIKYRAPLG